MHSFVAEWGARLVDWRSTVRVPAELKFFFFEFVLRVYEMNFAS